MPIILNAANEVAVKCFLDKKLSFQNIFKLIASTLNYADRSNIKLNSVSLKSITDFNDEAKNIAHHHLKKLT
jgi:1-deoxy-D-xylulose 5-phosphate reductoisomerase